MILLVLLCKASGRIQGKTRKYKESSEINLEMFNILINVYYLGNFTLEIKTETFKEVGLN